MAVLDMPMAAFWQNLLKSREMDAFAPLPSCEAPLVSSEGGFVVLVPPPVDVVKAVLVLPQRAVLLVIAVSVPL